MYVYNWLLHGFCNLLVESSMLLHLTETFLVACMSKFHLPGGLNPR